MRIDMPKKTKKKQRKVYLHEDVKKQVEQATKNLETRIRKIERIERNRKPDFRRRTEIWWLSIKKKSNENLGFFLKYWTFNIILNQLTNCRKKFRFILQFPWQFTKNTTQTKKSMIKYFRINKLINLLKRI